MWNDASIDDHAIDIGDPGRITICPRLGLRAQPNHARLLCFSLATRRVKR
jgi:hypothetical protein